MPGQHAARIGDVDIGAVQVVEPGIDHHRVVGLGQDQTATEAGVTRSCGQYCVEAPGHARFTDVFPQCHALQTQRHVSEVAVRVLIGDAGASVEVFGEDFGTAIDAENLSGDMQIVEDTLAHGQAGGGAALLKAQQRKIFSGLPSIGQTGFQRDAAPTEQHSLIAPRDFFRGRP